MFSARITVREFERYFLSSYLRSVVSSLLKFVILYLSSMSS